MTEIALATFESVPRMLAWATTAGAVVDTGVVADELRSDLIENGVPAENADKLAMVGAVPYSALNFLEYKMLAGKLAPGLFKTLRGIADQQFKATVKRFGVNLAASFTTEMVAETAQDLIELAQAFGAQQGVKFGDESRRGFDWVAAYGRAAA